MSEETTVNQLTEAVTEAFTLRNIYEEKKKESSEAYNKYTSHQEKVINMLEELNLNSFKCEAGDFTYRYDESFRVPKDHESKMEFFKWYSESSFYITVFNSK